MIPEVKKRDLFGCMLPHLQYYKRLHPRTADLDLPVIRKYAEGKSAIQISLEVPCAEATVYRAVTRIERFLSQNKALLSAELSNR